MKKYNTLYCKTVAQVCYSLALPVFLIFFIVSMFYDVLANDILLSFIISFGTATLIFLAFISRTLFSCKAIREAENRYHTEFNDNNAKQIARKSMIFTSDEWLIYSGRFAVYKASIVSITVKNQNKYNNMGGYYCTIKTQYGKKYRMFISSLSEYKTVKNWLR